MIIRVSPQWQVTIPAEFRREFGAAKQVEAGMENQALILRPILADSVDAADRLYAPQGITREVLYEAVLLVEKRRQQAAC